MHLGAIAPFRLMLEPEIRLAVSDRSTALTRRRSGSSPNEDALQAIAADLARDGYLTGDDIEAAIARGRRSRRTPRRRSRASPFLASRAREASMPVRTRSPEERAEGLLGIGPAEEPPDLAEAIDLMAAEFDAPRR